MTLFCPAHALSQDQVVAAIYETMIRPEQFDRFSAARSARAALAERADEAGHRDWTRRASVLRAHFSRAAEIHEQQWEQAGKPGPDEFSGACARFWLVAAPGSGGLLNASERASRQLEKGAHLPDAMKLTQESSDLWAAFLERLGMGDFSWQEVVVLNTRHSGEKYLCRPVRLRDAGGKDAVAMAERFDCEWRDEAADSIAAALGLQKPAMAQLEAVLKGAGRGVVEGLGQAAARVGAPGAAELIRLTAFLMNEHVRDLKIARGELLPPAEEVQAENGQNCQYFRFGAETGLPVIFIHGMLDGIAPLQRLQPQLRKLGFRVYAPMRAGYGASAALLREQDPQDAFVAQLETLIASENLQRPILLSHRAGVLYGCAAASRLQDRVSGLVAVAPNFSVSSPRQFSGLSGYAWLVAFAAVRAPWLLPVLMKGWSAGLQWYGGKALLRVQTSRGSREQEMLEQMELLPVLLQSQQLFRQQGGAGFLSDLQMIRQGGRKGVLARNARAVFVHGGEDRVAPLHEVRKALQDVPAAQLCVSQEAGGLLFYTFPELVLTALQDYAAAAAS